MTRTYHQKRKRVERLSKEEILDLTFDLINAFRLVKMPISTALFLQDLLTASEIKHLAKRLRIAKLLLDGQTHRNIAKKLHCSLATVTKVGFWLNQGGDGFREVISKLPRRYKMPKSLPRRPIEFQLPQVLIAATQETLYKHQQKQIDKVSDLYDSLESKRVMDKALQEMFDYGFRNALSEKKEFRKKIKK